MTDKQVESYRGFDSSLSFRVDVFGIGKYSGHVFDAYVCSRGHPRLQAGSLLLGPFGRHLRPFCPHLWHQVCDEPCCQLWSARMYIRVPRRCLDMTLVSVGTERAAVRAASDEQPR